MKNGYLKCCLLLLSTWLLTAPLAFGLEREETVSLAPATVESLVLPIGNAAVQDSFNSFSAPAESTAELNYEFTFSSPEPGEWSYQISDNQSGTQSTGVILTMTTGSNVRATIFGGDKDYVAGEEMTLATVSIDGDTPLKNYTVTASVTNENDLGNPVTLQFLDDGGRGDRTAGDGISTTIFQPAATGTYSVQGFVEGNDLSGNAYRRSIAARFRVIDSTADIVGGLEDRADDEDTDGIVDSILVGVTVDVLEPGNYTLNLTLQTLNGEELFSRAGATLQAGSNLLEVPFRTSDLKDIGEDGPYHIIHAVLELDQSGDALVVDRLDEVGETSRWELSSFGQHPLEYLGNLDASGVDQNADGSFDVLSVSFDLSVKTSGNYSFSAQLLDANNKEIGVASGSSNLGGTARVTLEFPGDPIASNGVDGPYSVRHLTINGPAAAIFTKLGSTPFLSAEDFGSNTGPRDMDNDGVIDELDRCPATVVPESVPTRQLRRNRFAIDGSFDSREVLAFKTTSRSAFNIVDTGGCSCEQVLIEQGSRSSSETQFGCTSHTLLLWTIQLRRDER